MAKKSSGTSKLKQFLSTKGPFSENIIQLFAHLEHAGYAVSIGPGFSFIRATLVSGYTDTVTIMSQNGHSAGYHALTISVDSADGSYGINWACADKVKSTKDIASIIAINRRLIGSKQEAAPISIPGNLFALCTETQRLADELKEMVEDGEVDMTLSVSKQPGSAKKLEVPAYNFSGITRSGVPFAIACDRHCKAWQPATIRVGLGNSLLYPCKEACESGETLIELIEDIARYA